MGHAERIARKTAEVLESVGYACDVNGVVLTIRKWDVRVEVEEGQERVEAGSAVIFPSIVTYHRYLPGGFARELGAGMGEDLEQAAQMVSATWMLLFFPLLKFLFDEHPHDCTVVEEELGLPGAPEKRYRLIAGPVQTRGFEGDSGPGEGVQTMLWEELSEALLLNVRHGVHHVRCFAGRFGENVQADVFVDGEEWEEGSERLRAVAERFPTPDEGNPIHSLKQHLILRPEDLEGSLEEELGEDVRRWSEALEGRVDGRHEGIMPHVLRALAVMSRYGSEEEHEQLLVKQGVPERTAAELVTFMQSAAARVVLKDQVGFSETYYWTNARSRRAVVRRYDETATFTSAVATLAALNESGVAEREVFAVASTSAEMSGVQQVLQKNGKLEGLRFTTMIHHTDEPVEGEDLDELLGKAKGAERAPQAEGGKDPVSAKPWWKFW